MKFLYSSLLILISFQVQSQCTCEPIQASGTEITVSSVQELESAIDQANMNNGNITIILMPGTYSLSSNLRFIAENMENLTIMGSTENNADVVIKGLGWNNNAVTHIFNVAADNFTVANMTIGEVFYHPIQVHSNPADADNFRAQNVRFVDAKEQLLKVSGGGELFADNGSIMCCEFEFTEGIAYQYYTGGIDAHRSKDWEVRFNSFRGIRSPEASLAEHAIHFWRESSGTVVDANLIIDCDRGIGFGLGDDIANGHTGGLIMNNMVHTSRDVGIGLELSTDTKIYNNTVITENYPRSIEYRFAGTTDAHITNNIVNGQISDRSSGSTGVLSYNVTVEGDDRFVDASNYDFHIEEYQPDDQLLGAGIELPEVEMDFDCEYRTLLNASDIGADQLLIEVSTEDRIDELSIKIYPNPNAGEFELIGNIEGSKIKLIDQLGRVILKKEASTINIQFDISDLEEGIYFIQLFKENSIVTKKIIVTK